MTDGPTNQQVDMKVHKEVTRQCQALKLIYPTHLFPYFFPLRISQFFPFPLSPVISSFLCPFPRFQEFCFSLTIIPVILFPRISRFFSHFPCPYRVIPAPGVLFPRIDKSSLVAAWRDHKSLYLTSSDREWIEMRGREREREREKGTEREEE